MYGQTAGKHSVVTVKALKRALKKAGLKVSGKKSTLTRRARKARLMRGGDDDTNVPQNATNVPENATNVPPKGKEKQDGGYKGIDCNQPENREQPECRPRRSRRSSRRN
jgi:hypothetical protein